MLLNQLFEAITRTGKGNTAVVGWGRGMGHKGHMMLASSVITKAKEMGGDPYFVVSKTVGKDDPITPDEKLAIYKKVFPQSGHIFQPATDEMPDLTRVLTNLNKQGYVNAVVVVGADQVKAFQYLKNYNGKADKSGNVAFNFDTLDVISRQETGDPSAGDEGPRATPMRQVLQDPTKSDKEQFIAWRDAMSPEIGDDEVRDLMMKAKTRMAGFAKPKKEGVTENWGIEKFAIPLPIGQYLAVGSDEFAPPGNYKSAEDLHDEVFDLIDAGVEPDAATVNPRSLLATQDWLGNAGGDDPLFDEYPDRPVVYKKAGKLYILDGHHRTTRAWRAGRPIAVYLFSDRPQQDLDESAGTYREIEFVCANPDFCDATERTIVVANSPGEAAIKFKAETPEAYIKDIVAMRQGVAEGSYTTEKQILTRIRQIMYDRKLSGTESNAGELHRLKQQLKDMRSQQGVAEGNDDDVWGPQGNFAGDVPVNLGGAVSKRLDIDDIVSYFGEKATILAMSKDRTVSRINLKSGITQNVKTSDLKRVGRGVSEGVPQPGPSSGAPKQFGPDAKIETRQMTVKDIISSVPGVPYYNNVVDDWDAKDYSWGVTKKVIEYATYLKDHPESLAKLPPAIVLNGKFEDGAHRVSAIWLLQQRMDPKNPLWANAKLNVQFVKQGVAEDESNDTAISLSKLGKFHPGTDTLAEFVAERPTAQYALHPDKRESTFYSLTNKDSDKLKYYGPKKISIPPGTLVGDMAIANKFYRAKTPEEQEQYAELYKASLQPYPVDVSQYRMPELLIPKPDVAESDLDRFKKYIRPVVKTTPKIEKTTNPAGRTTDHVEWIVTSDTGEKRRFDRKKQAQEFYDLCTKQGVAEGLTPNTIHKLADRKGIKWDDEPSFLKLTKRLTGKDHLDDLDQTQLQTVKQYLEKQEVAEGSNKKEATRRIQKMLNDKYKANLDVDGILGPLTLKSINKFIPNAKVGLADEPNKTTAVQGKKVKDQAVAENFADGKNPQDRGDSARHGIPKHATIAQLEKIRSSKTASPRKKQLAHWQINMRRGKAK